MEKYLMQIDNANTEEEISKILSNSEEELEQEEYNELDEYAKEKINKLKYQPIEDDHEYNEFDDMWHSGLI